MPREKTLKICPYCGKILTAKDFFNKAYLGFDSLLERIDCDNCGYSGVPIEVLEKDYPKYTFKKP